NELTKPDQVVCYGILVHRHSAVAGEQHVHVTVRMLVQIEVSTTETVGGVRRHAGTNTSSGDHLSGEPSTGKLKGREAKASHTALMRDALVRNKRLAECLEML